MISEEVDASKILSIVVEPKKVLTINDKLKNDEEKLLMLLENLQKREHR